MKPIIRTLTTLLLLPATIASAQSMTLGAKFGANIARQGGDFGVYADPFNSRLGVVGGLTLALGFGDIVALQTEALYTEKGITGPDVFAMRMSYLETPLLVRLAVPTHSAVRPIILAGVAPAIETSCGGQTRPGGIPERPRPPPGPLDCNTMRTDLDDFGIIVAGGMQIAFGRMSLTAEARYTHGTTDLTSLFRDVLVHNRVLSLLVGTRLRLSS